MECPYCGAELDYEDSYGNRDYIIHGDTNGKVGNIYRCPNFEGFEHTLDAIEYAGYNGIVDYPANIVCESVEFNGFFHTDQCDNLYEGYPC